MSKESRELANAERKARYEARKAEIKANQDQKMSEIKARETANKEDFKAKMKASKNEFSKIGGELKESVNEFKDDMSDVKKDLKGAVSEAKAILKGEMVPPPKKLSEKKQAELDEKLKDPKFAAKYTAKQAKEAEFRAGLEKGVAIKAELAEKTGKPVFKKFLGTKRLTVFENGYVQVGLMGTPEKLLSVDGDVNIARKGAFGRTAGGLAGTLVGLGPVNMLSPSNRGDLSLTIVTDVTAHSFHSDNPTTDNIKSFREAEVRCKALLKSLEGSSINSAQEPAASKLGLSEELEKISKLKEQGLLSEEEFAAAKAKLISG